MSHTVRIPLHCALCIMEYHALVNVPRSKLRHCSCASSQCLFSEEERRRIIDRMYLHPINVRVKPCMVL